MENQNNTIGLIAIAIALLLGLSLLSMGIRNGLARSSAIDNGMTPNEYTDWMDLVN